VTEPYQRAVVDPPRHAVVDAVQRAIAEDLTPLGDLTSSILSPDLVATATFVPRVAGVLAGRACAAETFIQIDPSVELVWLADDGDGLTAGSPLCTATGSLRSILTAERTALNFLGHLSGIATATSDLVGLLAAAGSATRVWDTRKTTPGLRALEKAAVRAGGGANHRGNLSDWILLKDNHLALLGIDVAVATARAQWPARTVHVECDTLSQVDQAVRVGADALLLDNMSPETVEEAVAITLAIAAESGRRKPLLEVSGGITAATIASYGVPGIDCISVGAITNSAPVLDIGLDIEVPA
jgi:nicotinate-nucleotide pyrophosphorylase (carboxylating)